MFAVHFNTYRCFILFVVILASGAVPSICQSQGDNSQLFKHCNLEDCYDSQKKKCKGKKVLICTTGAPQNPTLALTHEPPSASGSSNLFASYDPDSNEVSILDDQVNAATLSEDYYAHLINIIANYQFIELLLETCNNNLITLPPPPPLSLLDNNLEKMYQDQLLDKTLESGEQFANSLKKYQTRTKSHQPSFSHEHSHQEMRSITASLITFFKLVWKPYVGSLAVAGVFQNLAAVFYEPAIRMAMAVYDQNTITTFRDCEIAIDLELNEALSDMKDDGVITEHFTSSISLATLRDGVQGDPHGLIQTTGRFIGFLTSSRQCECPYCQIAEQFSNGDFGGCLTDFNLQLNVFLLDLKRLLHNDWNATIPSRVVVSGYFIQFDSPEGITHSSCSCSPCPEIDGGGSEAKAGAAIFFTSFGLTLTLAVPFTATYLLCLKDCWSKLSNL